MVVSILSERRAFQPYGLEGGCPGGRGLNLLTHKNESRVVNLGGKNTVRVSPGDRLAIHSPGGGGYGDANSSTGAATATNGNSTLRLTSGSLNQYVMNQESV